MTSFLSKLTSISIATTTTSFGGGFKPSGHLHAEAHQV
jgi:hypothetical protein